MKRINLLPPEQRVKASRERGLLWAVLILVVVVAALGAVYWLKTQQVSSKQAELDAVTAQVFAEQAKAAKLQPYAIIQETRAGMMKLAQRLYYTRIPFSMILQEISLVIPDMVRLQTLQWTLPPTMYDDPSTPAVSADVTFAGTAPSHEWVADFMTHLGLIPQLTNIKLVSSTGAAPGGSTQSPVSFQVTASLRHYQMGLAPDGFVPGAGQ
jgi:Tfp pilus assembly protein PilN